MEIDLEGVGEDLGAVAGRLRSQVCIAGGGIAGLILAHRLSSFCTVTLLEAGGREKKAESGMDPFSAELQGVPHNGTRVGRVRALGGCSLTWGGQLLGLPEDAGWPVSGAELSQQGANWRMPEDTAAFLAEHRAELPALLKGMPELTARLSRFVPFSMRNLAMRPGRELLASRRVKVVLHARVRELVFSGAGDRVTGVEVVTPSGKALRVEAQHFVVAAGTVETCRLLLTSRGAAGRAVGDAFGQVGKNFHDHLTISAAIFTGAARARVLGALGPRVFGGRGQRRAVYSLKLEASAGLRAELALRPAMAHLTVEEPDGSGLGVLRGWLRARQEGRSRATGQRMWKEMPRVLERLVRLAWVAGVRQRRYVSPEAVVRLQINMAQDAPSSSLVRLSETGDEDGVPRAVVDWRVSTEELRSLRRFAQHMKRRLEASGFCQGVAWECALVPVGPDDDQVLLERLDDARHAMGGACMGTDAQSSVVDAELRVHGVENLWVASAAVFPDGSAMLPTLTLSALCVRLAERLRRELA